MDYYKKYLKYKNKYLKYKTKQLKQKGGVLWVCPGCNGVNDDDNGTEQVLCQHCRLVLKYNNNYFKYNLDAHGNPLYYAILFPGQLEHRYDIQTRRFLNVNTNYPLSPEDSLKINKLIEIYLLVYNYNRTLDNTHLYITPITDEILNLPFEHKIPITNISLHENYSVKAPNVNTLIMYQGNVMGLQTAVTTIMECLNVIYGAHADYKNDSFYLQTAKPIYQYSFITMRNPVSNGDRLDYIGYSKVLNHIRLSLSFNSITLMNTNTFLNTLRYNDYYLIGPTYNNGTKLTDVQCLVTGKCKTGESDIQAAQREVAEELGLVLNGQNIRFSHNTAKEIAYIVDINNCDAYDPAVHAGISLYSNNDDTHRKVAVYIYGTYPDISAKIQQIRCRCNEHERVKVFKHGKPHIITRLKPTPEISGITLLPIDL